MPKKKSRLKKDTIKDLTAVTTENKICHKEDSLESMVKSKETATQYGSPLIEEHVGEILLPLDS